MKKQKTTKGKSKGKSFVNPVARSTYAAGASVKVVGSGRKGKK